MSKIPQTTAKLSKKDRHKKASF